MWFVGLRHGALAVSRLLVFRFVFILAATLGTSMAQIDNIGTDFIVGFLPNYELTGNIELHVTAATASTSVTVEYPVGTTLAVSPVAVVPGEIAIISLPITASSDWVADTVSSNGVRVSAPDAFIAYMINRQSFTSDAALALPVDALNTEYIVIDNEGFSSYPAEFVVMAAFDNTVVTITPANSIVGHSAATPFTVTLDRGQGYFATAVADLSLTGSIISATRPITLTNGRRCANIPKDTDFCDHIFEVAQPVQSWGKQIAVVNLPQRPGGSIYRIVASEDNTDVRQNGIVVGTTLSRGGFYESPFLAENVIFESDRPIFVTQYMTGSQSPSAVAGDPSMGNMIPTDQYLRSYTFSTVGGGQFNTHYVSIIANIADVGTLTLDGAAVPVGSFSQIGSSNFYAVVLSLAEGTHTTSSQNVGHGITVEGYNADDSYLYPGGARFQSINPVGDPYPPVCTEMSKDQNSWVGQATDNKPSEDVNGNSVLDGTEDVNGNGVIDEDTGIFSVVLQDGFINVKLIVSPYVPGDPSVQFTVDRINAALIEGSGTVLVTDGAGNNCTLVVGFLPPTPAPTPAPTPNPTNSPTPKPSAAPAGKGNGKGNTPKPTTTKPTTPKPTATKPTTTPKPATPKPSKPTTPKPTNSK